MKTTDNPKGVKGICRRCKKFVDRHYGDNLYCYGDSKSQEKFVSYKCKNVPKINLNVRKR